MNNIYSISRQGWKMSTDIALRLLIDIIIIMRQSKFEDDKNDEH